MGLKERVAKVEGVLAPPPGLGGVLDRLDGLGPEETSAALRALTDAELEAICRYFEGLFPGLATLSEQELGRIAAGGGGEG